VRYTAIRSVERSKLMMVSPPFTTVFNAKSFDAVWLPVASDLEQDVDPIPLGEDLTYREAVRAVLAHARKKGVKITHRTISFDKIDRWFDLENTDAGVMSIYPHEHDEETS
jgi:hypothetical protein